MSGSARTNGGAPIGVFVLHGGDRLLGEALCVQLVRRREFRVVGTAPAWGAAAADDWQEVDVALLNCGVSLGTCSREVARLRGSWPSLKVVVLGLRRRLDVLRCLQAGAHGYLRQNASGELLTEVVRAVHRGESPCSANVAYLACRRLAEISEARASRPRQARPSLTGREIDIMRLVGRGLANKEIAHKLGISVATVKNHVHTALGKLGANRRQEAFRLACATGLLSEPEAPEIEAGRAPGGVSR